jgi:hypothetical protein
MTHDLHNLGTDKSNAFAEYTSHAPALSANGCEISIEPASTINFTGKRGISVQHIESLIIKRESE